MTSKIQMKKVNYPPKKTLPELRPILQRMKGLILVQKNKSQKF